MNKKLFLIFSFVGIHILQFYIAYIFSQKDLPDDSTNESTKNAPNANATLKQLWSTIGVILSSTAIFSLRRAYSYYIRSSFEIEIKDQIASAWLSNNTNTGLPYFQEVNSGEVLPICDIFSKHISVCARGVALSVNLLSDLTSVIVNIYTLGRLFKPRLAMIAVLYGISTTALSQVIFSKVYNDLSSDVTKEESEINARIVNLQEFGQQVIAFNGEKLELERLTAAFRKRELLAKKNLFIQIKDELYSITTNRTFSLLLDVAVPDLQLFLAIHRTCAYYFNQVLNDFIHRMREISSMLTNQAPEIMVSIDHVTKFTLLMEKWYQFKSQNLLKQEYAPNHAKLVSIEKLKVHIPDRDKKDSLDRASEILENPNLLYGKKNKGTNLEFQKGKVYLFPDFSEKGKTTLLKSILGMYPYAKGRIVYPCREHEVRYVSRNTFFSKKNTLLESIIVPQALPKEQKELDELVKIVSDFIDEVGLLNGEKHKKHLTEKMDWFNTLSDGEKQSFAVTNLLLSKPKILVLDEAFGGLDKPSKSRVEWILKKHLAETVILYADHHPIRGFSDYVVRIKDGDLTLTKANEELDRMEQELNTMISRNSLGKGMNDSKLNGF